MPSISVLDLGQKFAWRTQHRQRLHPKPSGPAVGLGLPESWCCREHAGAKPGTSPCCEHGGRGRNTHWGEPFPGEDHAQTMGRHVLVPLGCCSLTPLDGRRDWKEYCSVFHVMIELAAGRPQVTA